MGMLTVPELEETLSRGCAACAGTSLRFRAYVDAGVPMMAAEPVGKLYWAYNGEKFVDGVFEIACAKCSVVLFASDVCPRCHAPGGLEVALDAEPRTHTPHRMRVRAARARRCASSHSSPRRWSTKGSAPRRPRPPSSPTTPVSMATESTARHAAPWRSSMGAVRCAGRANRCDRARSRSPNAEPHALPLLHAHHPPRMVRI
jgi:hypothetical protein